jgi:hypothetical protein
MSFADATQGKGETEHAELMTRGPLAQNQLGMISMCRIEGCDAKPVAKGLCPKHYMRERRHGSVDEVRKSGRPRDQVLDLYRSLFREWSPRTLARYKRTMDILNGLKLAEVEIKAFIINHTRPNGTLKVSTMLMLAEVNKLMIRDGLTMDQAIVAYISRRRPK